MLRFTFDRYLFELPDILSLLLYLVVAFFMAERLSKHGVYYFRLFLLLSILHLAITIYYWYASIFTLADATFYYGTIYSTKASWLSNLKQGIYTVFFFLYPLVKYLNLSYLGCYLIFSLIGLTGYYYIISAIFYLANKYNLVIKRSHFYLLLLPGLHYWNVAIGKDSLIFFFIVMLMNGIIRRRFFFIILGVVGIGFIRSHILLLFLLGYIIGNLVINKRITIVQKGIGILFSFGVLVFFLPLVLERISLGSTQLDSIQEFIGYRLDRNQGRATSVDMSNANMITKIVSYLFRPLFFDADNILTLLSSIENCVWIYMVVSIVKNIKFKLVEIQSSGVYSTLFFSFLVPVIASSYLLSNLGIAVRQKTMFFPLIIVMLFLSYDAKIRRSIQIKYPLLGNSLA